MARATTNKSIRLERSQKQLRRQSPLEDETPEQNPTAGASGEPRHSPKRPGRAASILGTAHVTRSQRWRSPMIGTRSRRRGVLAKGSRTGRNAR